MTLLHQIKVLEATHQSTLLYIYIYIFYIALCMWLYICHKQIYFNINLQGNIHNIVTAEISAHISLSHSTAKYMYIWLYKSIHNHIYQYIIVIYACKTINHVLGFSNDTQKSVCVSRRKSFTRFSSWKSDRRRRLRQKRLRLREFEVTGQLFAYSTNLLQHVTVYKQ